jgi:hypothetical protein
MIKKLFTLVVFILSLGLFVAIYFSAKHFTEEVKKFGEKKL